MREMWHQLRNRRGMTLVELMIVVAIVGILASIGTVAFLRQIKQAKITKLKEYTMDAARGQRDMFARHGAYYPFDTIESPQVDGTQDRATAGTEAFRWGRILGFNKDLPEGVVGFAYGGSAGDTCEPCTALGMTGTPDTAWYAIEFRQDLDNSGGIAQGDTTRVIITSELEDPYVLNEGQ